MMVYFELKHQEFYVFGDFKRENVVNASMLRSVKPALIGRALDVEFWNVLET